MRDRQVRPLGRPQLFVAGSALFGLLLLIALGSASANGGPEGAGAVSSYGPALLRAVVILVAIAEALVIALVIWALWPDGERRGAPQARRSWLAMTLATFLQMGTAMLLLWYLRHRRAGSPLIPDGSILNGVAKFQTSAATSALPGGSEWLTALIVAGVIALAGWRAWRTFGLGRHRRRLILAEQLTEALTESIENLESDPDPRRAVIAAYARMTALIGGGGLPRQPQDTALEYLARVLAGLEVPEDSIRRLTELFQFAKFSPHEVDEKMKADAIQALEEIRLALQRLRSGMGAALRPAAPAP